MSASWPDVERALCRIPDVLRAQVVSGTDGRVRALHVVAAPDASVEQLVREVRAVALGAFGVDVDPDAVEVARLAWEPATTAAAEAPAARRGRTLLAGMVLESAAGQLSVSVALAHAGRDARGSSGPPAGVRGLPRLTAVATLDALAQLHPAVRAEVFDAEVRELGAGRVAVVSVAPGGERDDDLLVGTAEVRAAGESDAVARAVLDALNRRLPP